MCNLLDIGNVVKTYIPKWSLFKRKFQTKNKRHMMPNQSRSRVSHKAVAQTKCWPELHSSSLLHCCPFLRKTYCLHRCKITFILLQNAECARNSAVFLALLVIKLIITLVHTVQLFDSRRDDCLSTVLVERLFGVCSDVNHGPINECSLFSIKLLACMAFLRVTSTTPELGTKNGEELCWAMSANGDESGRDGPKQNWLKPL